MKFNLFWFWLSICTPIWVIMAADAMMKKTPWREWVPPAAGFAAVFAAGFALAHLAASWLTQTPLGWLLFLGFIVLGLFVRALASIFRC